ncbi:MAG TPA: transposase [Acidobacteria bacterium]|jgi:putative transposase|nr:transposase [Acidobacteriota bacterium]
MPRTARIVVPGIPHHVIQRGNRSEVVFFKEEDRRTYLKILTFFAKKYKVEIWSYCLMTNHLHLAAVPSRPESLAKMMGAVHKRYTALINIRNNWKGTLWQGRYLSYPMDERYLYTCIKYIERNPVRAKIVKRAEDYPWSSARAHIFKWDDPVLSSFFMIDQIKDWRAYLQEKESEEDLEKIRKNQSSGHPLGNERFYNQIEKLTGLKLKKEK